MIVYTGGSFDLFHAGHVNFLRQCGNLGKVVVSLNTDEFVKKFKGQAPIMSYNERKAVLESCVYVDRVIENLGGANSKLAIDRVKPNIIAIGTDWENRDYHKQMGFTQEWLDEREIKLIYLPYSEGISSSEIKKRI